MDRLMRVTAIAAGLLALCWVSLASHQATRPADRILAAMVREDGVVVPFAEYRGDTWMLPGVELTNRATPWFNTAEAAPTTWAFPTNDTTVTVTTTNATKIASHCESYWGLASNHRGRPVAANTSHRNIGVALSGAGSGETFATMKASDTSAARIVAYIRAQFDRMETEGSTGDLPHLSLAERRRLPLAITRILQSRTRVDGQTLTFVEAIRKYPPGCGRESVWQVWVVDDGGASLTLLNSVLTLTDCDHKEVASLAPLAVMLVDGRRFIFAEELGYESEHYVIFEVEPRAIVRRVSVWGGGC